MQYEILEHIGDVKIKAYGKTKEELFENAMLGMNAILKPRIKEGKAKIRHIVLSSLDLNALLVDFLNEINYLRQVNKEVYDKVSFETFSDTELKAKLRGKSIEEFGEDIKAVTFHEMDIKKNIQGFWETTIVFDV